MLALAKQFHSRLNADLGAALNQLGQLLIGQALEEGYSAQFVDAHQTVAR
jgi:hypothetical protein